MLKSNNHSIFLFSISLAKGGAENQLVKLALFLAKKNYDVKIVYGLAHNDFHEELTKAGIGVQFINYKSLVGLFKLLRFVKNEKPDLMISFMFGMNLICRMLKFFSGIPLITSVRNNEISNLYFWLYRISYNIDTLSTFNSEYALKKFIAQKLTNPKKSVLQNNAIKISESHSNSKKTKVFTIISLAHFRPQKDYITLFVAIKILKDKNIPVKLFVLGHTFDQNWPFDKLKSMEIEELVSIVGFVQNTGEYLQAADALVLSSLWEGTPNAILEAMAHKLPVISSRIPGCESLVLNSECGFLFEKQNPEQLAERIVGMMQISEKERQDFGQNGYQYVYDNYREEVVYKQWLTLIKRAIKSAA